uniref:Peptidase S54 rhomboid domain-containing protein n=2 Tax=Aegilops tauschii subsp. strangulata TaxID=200361 RepID=A0A453PY20_AEGTS
GGPAGEKAPPSPSPLPPRAASPPPCRPTAHPPLPLPRLLLPARGTGLPLPLPARTPGPRSPPGSLLPTSAAAVVPAARGAGSPGLEISAPQRGRTTSGWPLPSSALLHAAAPWALWTSATADDMVGALMGANLSVFMLWRVLAHPRFITDPHMVWLDMYLGGRLHTLLMSAWNNVDPMFMRKHFMTSLDNFTSGRLHTMLTSSFSHMDLKHLFNNMVGLYFFGSSIARTFGPGFLFQLYVTGALTGSVFYLAEKIFLAPRKEVFGGWKTPCLGASAAVNAIILLEIFLHPTKLLYLHLFIPVPAALMGVGLIGADLWRVKKGESRVSGSSHLGGALVAAAAFAEIKGWI